MSHLELLIAALLLDALLGEPNWLWTRAPHPAVLMGNLIDWFDRTLNHGKFRLFKGVATAAILAVIALTVGWLIALIPDFGLLELALAAILLAQKSLMDHVGAVARALDDDIVAARRAVSHIVGRETRDLDETGVARAAIESAAENFSDGVIAPALWFLVGGAPGILLYKMVNTADSMIGYRTPEYEAFGKAAARLDDLMNWIPARLTGLLIAVVGRVKGTIAQMQEDAAHHRSPNAGWPEGAVAATLGIALSGPRRYGDSMTKDAYVNGMGRRTLGVQDIRDCTQLLTRVWAVFLLSLTVLWIPTGFY